MLGIVTETCHYCRRGRSPLDIMRLPSGMVICQTCYRRHVDALQLLGGGKAPAECTECNAKLSELLLANGGQEFQMAVHYENGLYRVMCPRCSDTYIPKRRDLYGDTAFGFQQKLK